MLRKTKRQGLGANFVGQRYVLQLNKSEIAAN